MRLCSLPFLLLVLRPCVFPFASIFVVTHSRENKNNNWMSHSEMIILCCCCFFPFIPFGFHIWKSNRSTVRREEKIYKYNNMKRTFIIRCIAHGLLPSMLLCIVFPLFVWCMCVCVEKWHYFTWRFRWWRISIIGIAITSQRAHTQCSSIDSLSFGFPSI